MREQFQWQNQEDQPIFGSVDILMGANAKPFRHTLTDDERGLTIVIPVKRDPFLVGLHCLFLPMWILCMIPLSYDIAVSVKGPADILFLIIWFCIWSIGGIVAILNLVWHLRGQEVVNVSPTLLRIRREIPGWTRIQEFNLANIQNLRAAKYYFHRFYPVHFIGIGVGSLVFDHHFRRSHFKTIEFGDRLDSAESEFLVRRIVERFPQLSELVSSTSLP